MVNKYQHLFKGVIIENTFTSFSVMAYKCFPFLKYFGILKPYLQCNGWQSDKLVKDINIPTLFITGDADEIIPY